MATKKSNPDIEETSEVIERPARRGRAKKAEETAENAESVEREVIERPARRSRTKKAEESDTLADAATPNHSETGTKQANDSISTGTSPESTETASSGTPAPLEKAPFYINALTLKRPAGRLTRSPAHRSFKPAEAQTNTNTASQTRDVFVPKSLDKKEKSTGFVPKAIETTESRIRRSNIFWQIPEESFSASCPAPKISARYSHDDIERLLLAHNGTVKAHANNRAPATRTAAISEAGVNPEINVYDYRAFTERLNHLQLLAELDDSLTNCIQWYRVIPWYGEANAQNLFPKPHTAEAQSTSESSAQSNTPGTAPAVGNSQRQNATPVADPAESLDPAVVALFEIFKQELQPLVVENNDPHEILLSHLSIHSERITSLLCDWARALPMIDLGVTDGAPNRPLLVYFIDRFERILDVDMRAAAAQNVVLPDIMLRERFGLDNIDLLILWILTALEIDPRFRQSMMASWNLHSQIYISAGVLMRFLTMSARQRADILNRVSPSSTMESLGLFRVNLNTSPTSPLYYEIVVSEQIIHMFTGTPSLSLLSRMFAEIQFPTLSNDVYISPEHEKTLDIVRNYYVRPQLNTFGDLKRNNLDFIPSLGFLIEGLPGTGRCTLMKIIATRLSKPIIIVQSSPFAALHPNDLEDYLRVLFNDAMLMNAILCFRDAATIFADERISGSLARKLATRAVVCAMCVDLAVKIPPVMEPYITFKTKMTANLKETASSFWRSHLMLPLASDRQVNVKALTEQLALQPFQIQKATKLAYYSTDQDAAKLIELNNESLQKAAAVQVQKNIGSLAFVTDPEITLDDVIVSDDIMDKIKQIIGSARNRRRVLYEWGLSRRIRRGTGVIALFDGEPGTGKTHSAEAIAKSLGLSLMRVNIATMVDKYIGETEKNLTTIFEQARPDMQLLLFDEADSLFAKRTANVSKSNDRYSNMSVNVLLQLIERYEGVSVLTTNLKNALDPAFERRITYKIYFPMPKQPERERLWRYMCPPDILTSEPIDYEWLSELEMSGGEIKNAVLTAAFNAATMGVLLNSEILYNAGVAEASAAGRVLRRYEEGQEDFT